MFYQFFLVFIKLCLAFLTS